MLKKSLQLCAEIESTVGKIYRSFAQSTESSPELKQLWNQMALDEDDHEKQIRFALRLPTEEICQDAEVEADRNVDAFYREVKKLYARVERESLNAQKMLDLAEYLEGKFLAVHIANAASCRDERLKQMFTALGKPDQEHVAQLTRYREKQRSVPL